uniref:Non-specific protein-tyrosine kinase n=1 Tax=Macrostomum lignano TaxID=282301 RepID=A0A1I8JRR7_9PLAT
ETDWWLGGPLENKVRGLRAQASVASQKLAGCEQPSLPWQRAKKQILRTLSAQRYSWNAPREEFAFLPFPTRYHETACGFFFCCCCLQPDPTVPTDHSSWFLGQLSRKEAERQLLMLGQPAGHLSARCASPKTHRRYKSDLCCSWKQQTGLDKRKRIAALPLLLSPDKSYSLSVLDLDKATGRDTVKHYRIRLLDNGAGFYITSRRTGSGQFGEVWRALFNDRKERLRHPKLVQLCPVCTGEDPVFICHRVDEHGSLLAHLRDSRPLLELDVLVDILGQVRTRVRPLSGNVVVGAAVDRGNVGWWCGRYRRNVRWRARDGLPGSEKFIHRDLAARNILVGDNNTVKVADIWPVQSYRRR